MSKAQPSIFDFMGVVPNVGEKYMMAIREKIGWRMAMATVKEVRDSTVCCDIDSNYRGTVAWNYSEELSLDVFNEFHSEYKKLFE